MVDNQLSGISCLILEMNSGVHCDSCGEDQGLTRCYFPPTSLGWEQAVGWFENDSDTDDCTGTIYGVTVGDADFIGLASLSTTRRVKISVIQPHFKHIKYTEVKQ